MSVGPWLQVLTRKSLVPPASTCGYDRQVFPAAALSVWWSLFLFHLTGTVVPWAPSFNCWEQRVGVVSVYLLYS